MARINKKSLIDRVKLYRDSESELVAKENAEHLAKYEEKREEFEKQLMPRLLELRNVLNQTLISQQRPPTVDEIPEYFRNSFGGWKHLLNGPQKPHPIEADVRYYDMLLSFLASVQDETVTETALAKAGFHDIGRFFADPGHRGYRHPGRRNHP